MRGISQPGGVVGGGSGQVIQVARSVKGCKGVCRCSRLGVVGFQLFQVRQQLLFIRHACEVVANHLVRPERRLAPSPQADQHAGNDRAVRLNFDAVGRMAQQMPTAQYVLEKPEENFTLPSIMHPLSQLLCQC